jgi:hypothetical protein
MAVLLYVFPSPTRYGQKYLLQINNVSTGPGWGDPIRAISESTSGLQHVVWMNTNYWRGGLTPDETTYPALGYEPRDHWEVVGRFRLNAADIGFFEALGQATYFCMRRCLMQSSLCAILPV